MGIRDLLFNLSFSFDANNAMREASKFDTKIGQILISAKDATETLSKLGNQFKAEELKNSANQLEGAFKNAADSILECQSTAFEGVIGQWDKQKELANAYASQLEVVGKHFVDLRAKQKGLDYSTAFYIGHIEAKKFSDAILQSTNSTKQLFDMFGNTDMLEKLGIKFQDTLFNFDNQKLVKSLGAVTEKAAELQKSISNPKLLAKYKQTLNDFTNAADGSREAVAKLNKDLKKLNKTAELTEKVIPDMIKQFKDIGSQVLYPIMQVLSLSRAVMDSVSAQNLMATSLHELGLTTEFMVGKTAFGITKFNEFYKTLTDYSNKVRDIGATTQTTLVEVTEAFTALANTRVSRNQQELLDMTKVLIQMGQAFSMSNSEAANLVNTLVKVGGVKSEDIRAIADEMAKVQRVYGLTAGEAQEVASSTARVLNRMNSMTAGAVKNAKAITKEIAKMTVTFTRAGLAANEASDFIDRMMDPDKIEENIYLWSRMGINVSEALDMMSGNGDQMAGMTEKLGAACNDLLSRTERMGRSGPLVFNELAKAMGMSAGKAKQLAEAYRERASMSAEQIAQLEKETDLERQAAESRLSLQKSLERIANTLSILISGFVEPLVNFLSPVIHLIAELGKGIGWLTAQLGKWGTAGRIVQAVLGLIVISMILTKGHAFALFNILGSGLAKLMGIIPAAGKMIGGFFNTLGYNIANAAKKGGLLEKLGNKLFKFGDQVQGIKGNSTGTPTGAPKAAEALGKNGPAADKGAGAMERISKIPAKNIMQLGIALLAFAAAIWVMAKALKEFIKIGQQFKPEEILVGAGMLILMTALLIGVAWALKKVGKDCSPEIAKLGAAMLMLAGAVWILVQAFKTMIKIVSNGWEAFKAGAAIIILIGALTVAMKILSDVGKNNALGLLVMGTAMLMLAGAVWILAQAMTVISDLFANKMDWKTLATLAGIIIVLGGAVFLLGKFCEASAGGLLALAVVMLAMAASVYIIAMSLEMMSKAKDAIGPLIVILVALCVVIALLGAIGTAAAPGLLATAVVLIAFGAAMLAIGFAIKLASEGLSLLVKTINECGEGMATKGLDIAYALTMIGMGAFNLGFYGGLGAIGILLLSGALLALSASGKGIKDLADGLKYISENTELISTGLGELKKSVGGMDSAIQPFSKAVGEFAKPMETLAKNAKEGAKAVDIILTSFSKLSEYVTTTATNLTKISEWFTSFPGIINTFTEQLNQLPNGLNDFATKFDTAAEQIQTGITKIGDGLSTEALKSFKTLGNNTTKLANNFEKMGNGIKMFADNIIMAVSGINQLKTSLEEDVVGLSENFVKEIRAVSGAVEGLNEVMAPGAIQINQDVNKNTDTTELVAKFDQVISQLNLIQINTKETAQNTKKIADKISSSNSHTNYYPTQY